MLANQRPAFPPPPPPPLLHSPYDPGVSAPMRSTSMTAPVSDMRSGHLPSDPASSVSPTSVNESGASSSLAQRLRTTAEDQSMPIESEEEENEGDVEEEEDGPGWHDQAARGVAFLSLSANGNPTYVGPSSGFSWARMVLGGIAGAAANEGGKYSSRATELDTSQPFVTGPPVQPVQLSDDALASITDEMADSLLSQCYRHIQPRYSFVDWLYVHEIWSHRLAITRAAALPGASRMMKTSAFFIWILFAIGARIGQKSAPTGLATPEAYYRKSMEYLETIVGLHDLKNVQALMLMVMYSFRSNEAPGVWYLVGISLRVACSLGLHRKVPPMQARRMSPYIIQLRRRIFWSVYTLDRMLAMSLGRPCGIADHDCDVELPLDFDCIATSFDTKNPPTGPTSMTSSILFTKLMRIETMIQKQAYRVDVSTPSSVESPDAVLKLIDQWEAQIPAAASDPNCWTIPLCSRDWLLARSGEARLYLLRPLTADPATAQPSHVRLIARFAADACETQKRFHQAQSVSLSLEALRSIFLSGLTLLHAVQLDNTAVSFSTLSKAIRAASNTMFLYAQSFPGARAYSEVFEELSSAVLDKLSAPNESSAPPPGLSDPAAATPLFQSLWDDIPSVMTNDAQDSFLALLESLGVPTDTLVDSASGNPFFSGGGAAGLDLSELGGFGPAAGGLEPFAVGTSSGGLW
ncbi:hypothetical protein Rhopal_004653-T1 [Rhodotorula paludigena]|uniref:Xylanolytic transcriptional activator regulatory domain-containing protein n=1 Tax=Rhodotorula paludigena TaxID=86838 RepID=A0AAV5GP14_9BASI|nr:hypothetical protein Rhopal_004653-T1 [Rhodotorula paludigena]